MTRGFGKVSERRRESYFGESDGEESESTQVWEHIKNLRKRVAGFN